LKHAGHIAELEKRSTKLYFLPQTGQWVMLISSADRLRSATPPGG
jgi:hypothetical protein